MPARKYTSTPHGTYYGYTYYRCRCNDCTEANLQQQHAASEKRRVRLLADPSLAPHGRYSTYTNWVCRCEPCTEANSVQCKAYAARRRGDVEQAS